jgi:hypothetical protein
MTPAQNREVAWMVAQMMRARDDEDYFASLLTLVQHWPDPMICSLADWLAPSPGLTRDRTTALAAIRGYTAETPPDIVARVRVVGEEIARLTDGASA